MPSDTGVAQAGKGLGAFSTCTRHMRQLAAMDNFFVVTEMRDVNARLMRCSITVLPFSTSISCRQFQC